MQAKTNSEGKFSIDKAPLGQFRISSSLLGFKSTAKSIQIGNEPIRYDVELEPSEIQLEEIEVTAPPLAAVKGDTVEFNARNFATREYADANEMVAQVPGVIIDEEGNVQAHGEPVKRILVDGKEFFSTDPKVALKTLPADIIDKLQIIDEKSEQARFSGFDDGKRNKIINIVTKPDKRKGYFGRANGGKGDSDKFALSTNMNAFNGNQRLGVNFMGNNINETNFAEQGMGGMRRGNNNTDRGLSDTYAGAINYGNTWLGDKMEFNSDYSFRKSDTRVNSISDIEYLLTERANQFQNQTQESNRGTVSHSFASRIKWKIDSLNQLDINPNISYTSNSNINSSLSSRTIGQTDPLNKSDRNNSSDNSSVSFGGNLTYMRRLNHPGQTISINFNGNKSSNDAFGKTLAFNEYYEMPF